MMNLLNKLGTIISSSSDISTGGLTELYLLSLVRFFYSGSVLKMKIIIFGILEPNMRILAVVTETVAAD